MRMPGLTAEVALEPTSGRYGGTALAAAPRSGSLSPALVAPTVCRTSPCVGVGGCRMKIRCCRNFLGNCTCSTVPCFFLGPPEPA
jgi:hypothetical protein